MNSTFLMSEFEEKLKTEFPEINISYHKVDIAKATAHAFNIPIIRPKDLQKFWREISNFIALHFQRYIDQKFEQYNLYLFFEIQGNVEKELRYKIENDKFSSRKIIVSKHQNFDNIAAYHILNTLSIEEKSTNEAIEIENHSIVRVALEGKILRKRKITSEANEVYDAIVKLIKDEI